MPAAHAATYTVNANTDVADAIVGNGVCETVSGSGVCTLRAAIQESNASTSVTDSIHFNIGGGGTVSIAVNNLPSFTSSAVVDATTQPGWVGAPIVEVAGPGNGFGLIVTGGNATFRGFVINRFAAAVTLRGGPSRVEGNYIGTDVTGTTTTGYGNSLYGITSESTAVGGHTIGGTTTATRNVISGNAQGGIVLSTPDNIVRGNYIGTNAAGTAALPAQRFGIDIRQGFRNQIGGSGAGAGNVIAGNTETDVQIGAHPSQGPISGDHRVQGNLIGTNASGTSLLSSAIGIQIRVSSNDLIGGAAANEGNVIAAGTGVEFTNEPASGTKVQGNRINTNAAGTSALTGPVTGIEVGSGPTSLLIGGTTGTTPGGPCTGACNVLVGGNGIDISNTGTVVEGNFIGVDSTGTTKLSQAGWLRGSQNVVGGTTAAARNVISLLSVLGIDNAVQGNYIGVKSDGTGALNGSNPAGIVIQGRHTLGGATGTTPEGSCTGACNAIGGGIGVSVYGGSSTVQGNFIGLAPDGTTAIPNETGISTQGVNGLLGGSSAAERNVISGNSSAGISIQGTGGTGVGNEVAGNYIGVTADGSGALPNGSAGVILGQGAAESDVGGSATTRNLIAYNSGAGVSLASNAGAGNLISHNTIRLNGGLGIDISPDGPDANDSLDQDTGPNNRQNAPVLTSGVVSAAETLAEGTLNSEPSKTYTIDFYSNRECDPSGRGEAESHIGSTSVTTDASGNASFSVTLSAPPSLEQRTMTATATGPNDSTSELSNCVTRSYPRPRSASPVRVSLVPAYPECTAPNRTHGPPLEHPSCSAPAQASQHVAFGTPDVNARSASMTGLVRYRTVAGNPGTPADEADVELTVNVADVRKRSDLTDYTGELRAEATRRITDKFNGTGTEDGTVIDFPMRWSVPCVATTGSEGAVCSLTTSVDALVPGTVREGKRTVWELGAIKVFDGGSDGDADTITDDTLLATQGLFVP